MLTPQNGHVLCKLVNNPEERLVESGIEFNKKSLPIYEIIDMSSLSIDLELSKADRIITNSIPTSVKYDGQQYWLINQDYIASKVN